MTTDPIAREIYVELGRQWRLRALWHVGFEKFVNDGRLANLLKLLVVLICVGAILQRVLRQLELCGFSRRSGRCRRSRSP